MNGFAKFCRGGHRTSIGYALSMRVGVVVFANKWTGAGAVAELNCRALRSTGLDARLLFVGGRNLERRLDGYRWATPGLAKERRPAHIRSNLQAVTSLARECDIVICHLPHDHLLCVAAGVHRSMPLVRAFRNPRHLRRDPYHRFLDQRLTAALCANSSLERELRHSIFDLSTATLPVPLEDRFQPVKGSDLRDRLQVPSRDPVLGAVGKLAKGRGFGHLLDTAARLEAPAHVVVVGHGELQPQLEKRAHDLGIEGRVHWTGYQDEALPEMYSVMDVVLFTAPGSDWGHRAISEAQGCGRPVVAVSWPGVEDLIEDGVSGRIVDRDSSALARAVDSLIADPEAAHRLGTTAAEATKDRMLITVGRRLAHFLDSILSRKQLH
jgi:glycosyltransferase involved in cell wall biosynthesis